MNFIPEFLTMPFAMVLRFLTELFGSYGFALIAFALLVTAIRVPFDIKGKRGTMGTMVLQPQVKAIQEKYAGDQQRIMREQQKLYKEAGVKPMSGCLWNLFPMFILIIMISIVRQPLTHLMGLDEAQIEALRVTAEQLGIYVGTGAHAEVELAGYIRGHYDAFKAVVPEIFDINMRFLGMDIGQTPRWNFFMDNFTLPDLGLFLLPILATGAIYLQQKVMTATNYMQQQAQQMQMMKTMLMVMPLMSLWIGFTFPAAMSIYWMASGLMFTICSVFVNRHFRGIFQAMQADLEEKEAIRQAELEAKRKRTQELRAQNATQENKGTSKKKKQLAEREKEFQRQASQRALGREDEKEDEPSRVGHRKHARGRAYDPERYGDTQAEQVEEVEELLEDTLLTEEALGNDGLADDADFDAYDDDYEDEE